MTAQLRRLKDAPRRLLPSAPIPASPSQPSGGSVVLMHLGGYTRLDALPALVEGLRARDQTPTRISDMLES